MGNDTLDEAKLPMGEKDANHIRRRVDAVYRAESRRVFATLIRRLGDFDLVEEARAAYERALSLTRQPAERRFLERRLRELSI
jgi:predicted RNA polymerase sigma factor